MLLIEVEGQLDLVCLDSPTVDGVLRGGDLHKRTEVAEELAADEKVDLVGEIHKVLGAVRGAQRGSVGALEIGLHPQRER